VGCHGFCQQLAAFFSAATRSKRLKRAAQIVLGRGPSLRQIGFGPDLQSTPVGCDGFREQLGAFFSAAARSKAPKRGTQIVLSLGPILRRFFARIEGKSSLADLNGFSELSVAFCRFNHFASLDQKPSEGASRLAPFPLQREDFPE